MPTAGSQVAGLTGAGTYVVYGTETSFNNSTIPTLNKYFGRQQRATTMSVTSNFEYLYELYQRTASVGRYKQFEGSLTVESVMASPWVFNFLFGQDVVTGSSTYTHTFSRPTGTAGTQASLPSMAIQGGFTPVAANVVREFTGCVVKSVQMAGAVNDWVKLTTDMFFAQEQTPVTTLNTNTGPDSFAPFIFADGTLYIPGPATGGTAIAEVQNFTITMNNNLIPVYGINGSAGTGRFALEVLAQNFTVDLKCSLVFQNSTLLSDFLGMTNVSSTYPFAVKFTATDSTTVELDGLTGGYITDFGVTGVEPNALVLEDVTLQAIDAKVIATNTTASMP